MVIFKKKEPNMYLDLGKRLSKQEEKIIRLKEAQSSSKEPEQETSSTGFFGSFFSGSAQASEVQQESETEQKRKKLIKRVIELTERVESQEKEIYNLKNRMEVLERKQKLGY